MLLHVFKKFDLNSRLVAAGVNYRLEALVKVEFLVSAQKGSCRRMLCLDWEGGTTQTTPCLQSYQQ